MARVTVERFSVSDLSETAQELARSYAIDRPYHSGRWDEQLGHYAGLKLFGPGFQLMPIEVNVSSERGDGYYNQDVSIGISWSDKPISTLRDLKRVLRQPKAEDVDAARRVEKAVNTIIEKTGSDARFVSANRYPQNRHYALHEIGGLRIDSTLDDLIQDAIEHFSKVYEKRLRERFRPIYNQHLDDILNVKGAVFDRRGVWKNDAPQFKKEISLAAIKDLVERNDSPVSYTGAKAIDNNFFVHEYLYMDCRRLGSLREDRTNDLWIMGNSFKSRREEFDGVPRKREIAFRNMVRRGMSWQAG